MSDSRAPRAAGSITRHVHAPPPPSAIRIDLPPPSGLALRTPRMLLRALAPPDRDTFIDAVNASRAQLAPFMPQHRESESDHDMFTRQLELARPAAGHLHTSASYIRLVGLLADGRIAGGFNINNITRGLDWKADLNWWIAAPLAGRGLATEGLRALIAYAVADLPDGLGLHTLHAWITRDNPASARVAHKAGLVRAGEENSYISTGGRWVLHDLYQVRVAHGSSGPADRSA